MSFSVVVFGSSHDSGTRYSDGIRAETGTSSSVIRFRDSRCLSLTSSIRVPIVEYRAKKSDAWSGSNDWGCLAARHEGNWIGVGGAGKGLGPVSIVCPDDDH